MREATTAGSRNNGQVSSGGDGIVISSLSMVIAESYRGSAAFVDARQAAAPVAIIITNELPYSYCRLLADGEPGNESRAARRRNLPVGQSCRPLARRAFQLEGEFLL
jgi:hypothetical protein